MTHQTWELTYAQAEERACLFLGARYFAFDDNIAITFFFNEQYEEVAHYGQVTRCLTVFDPPRHWDPTFLDSVVIHSFSPVGGIECKPV